LKNVSDLHKTSELKFITFCFKAGQFKLQQKELDFFLNNQKNLENDSFFNDQMPIDSNKSKIDTLTTR
jgi:hypothetical protein